MHVLITGAGGFLGSRLVRHLLEAGDRVSGTYLDSRPDVSGVDLFEADLLDAAALRRVVAGAAPDVIVHLGALSHVGESWKRIPDYFRVNVLGTENLLAAAAAAGNPRVLIASSAEVYGMVPAERQPIREDEGLDPRSPYALTKAAAERLALTSAGGGAVVVRSFNLVGPGQSSIFALPAFALQLAAIARGEQEPVLRVGNLSARRDFLHVDDGAAAFRLLAERGEPGTAYNLASGRAVSIGEALERLRALAGGDGVEARVETDPHLFRPVDIPLLAGDPSRLRALGWQPRHTLDDALADLWQSVR